MWKQPELTFHSPSSQNGSNPLIREWEGYSQQKKSSGAGRSYPGRHLRHLRLSRQSFSICTPAALMVLSLRTEPLSMCCLTYQLRALNAFDSSKPFLASGRELATSQRLHSAHHPANVPPHNVPDCRLRPAPRSVLYHTRFWRSPCRAGRR